MGKIQENDKSLVAQIIENIGALGVGFKLAVVVSGYIGAGSFAKWVIAVWYPATRAVWDRVAYNLNLPVLFDYEKDALTALVFFLPFGLSALLAAFNKNKRNDRFEEADLLRERLFAAILGSLFLYLMCHELITYQMVG